MIFYQLNPSFGSSYQYEEFYQKVGQNKLDDPDLNTKKDRHEFRRKLIQLYGFELTDELWNGIEYAEGEIHNYSNRQRNMGPLAALVHMCDVWSARGWPDFPERRPNSTEQKTS